MRKLVRKLLLVFFLMVFLFSFWKVGSKLRHYDEGQGSYNQLEEYISYGGENSSIPSDDADSETGNEADVLTPPQETENAAATEGTAYPDLSGWPQVDFFHLSQINDEVVGWLVIEGTNVNYPVVQGEDNDYYLNHLFNGTYNGAGCLFVDYRCESDFSDKHSVIYGHHMKDKSMFAELVNYKKQAFYDEHPTALLLTPDAYYKIQFFSGYVADDSANAWNLMLDETNFGAWVKSVQRKSRFKTENLPTEEDRVITLSTCTYEFEDAKFVVHGYISEEILLPQSEY